VGQQKGVKKLAPFFCAQSFRESSEVEALKNSRSN
jgi:hypothetical protein